jgi:HicB family
MTVTLDLRPETEASLAALAAEQGVSLEQYISRLLEGQVPDQPPLSPAERAAAWREAAKGLPPTPLLSDDAISREMIYDARG